MRTHTRRPGTLRALGIIVLALVLLAGCGARAGGERAPEDRSGPVRRQDYNGKRLGVLIGPLMEDAAAEFFPDSEYLLFNSYPDCIAALLTGKIDAFLGDEPGMKSIHAAQPEIDYIHDNLTENNYSFAFRKNDPKSAALCAELNAFLARSYADGTMQELDDIWFGVDEARKRVDMSDLTGANGTIRVVTTSTDMPFSYIKDGKNVGYDIDLVVRFCRDRGYALELGDVDFAGRIPAVQSGKYDFTTDMNVTPEREEQVLFSDPTSHGGIVLAVLASDLVSSDSNRENGNYTSPDDLRGKTIACTTGSVTAAYVEEYFNGDVNVMFYDSHTDMVLALNSGKIDAYCTDSFGAKMQSESSGGTVRALEPPIHTTPVGFIFQKGSEQSETVRFRLNEYLTGLGRDRLSALQDYWLGDDEDLKAIDMTFTGENGHLKMAVATGFGKPWCYVKDGSIVGFEMQLAADFCREYGYSLEFVDYDFQGMLAAVQSGKCDMAGSAILQTPERMEQVDYSEPTADNVFVLVASSSGVSTSETLLERIGDSFQKTFLRENRWKLFLQGVGTTMLITASSILLGTALGFGVFLLCRRGNPVANGVTRFCVWLVHGMPMVVLLMILYYIIFGRVAISGALVSVIAFTLVFGAAMFGMLKSGVGAVDAGQMEAACALGYPERRAFFRVVLPQALPHFLPAYKGEITALIKATAVVGYVAVQDLTKMGDIVRSRTYEAFFPLIAVAVIYFLLAALLTAIVNRIELRLDPRRRRREDILKGLKVE